MKFNVNRVDNMVIQAIFLLDTLDKDINSFSMRVRFVINIRPQTLSLVIVIFNPTYIIYSFGANPLVLYLKQFEYV